MVRALIHIELVVVILYSPAGEAFPLERRLWLAALREAEVMGWKPAGTCAPPRLLGARSGQPWQGDYRKPCGQEVRREDALEFGLALGRLGKSKFDALRDFSLKSGFLICEPPEGWQPPADLLSLGQQAGLKAGAKVREKGEQAHVRSRAARK